MRKRKTRAKSESQVSLKSEDELARMRRAGQIVALTLDRLAAAAGAGATTGELDRVAEATIRSFGAEATFYGFRGYPAHICASVNDEVVHGIPGDRALKEGDIVSFDVGVTVEGMIADGAATVGVEPVSPAVGRLMQATREALYQGIAQARPGNRVADISAAVQRWVESRGYSVVRKLVGHGIGREMHEPPQVPNFADRGRTDSIELRPGMTLAIEPMVNEGAWEVVQDPDGWTYRTRDGSLSAHFEHTVAITEKGCEILTERESPAGRATRKAQESSGRVVAPAGGE